MDDMNIRATSSQQKELFSALYKEYQGSPYAVGSESMVHKHLRYDRITKIFEDNGSFSVHDVGAGLGHFYEFLKSRFPENSFQYSASELVKEYYDVFKSKYPDVPFYLRNILTEQTNDHYDYVVISGVFHQKRDITHKNWEGYVESMLQKSFTLSKKALIFNVMSEYADYYQAQIYYSRLNRIQDFIVKNLSRFFQIDHAYPLFEATIAVYQPEWIKNRFHEPELQKYLK